MPDRKLIPGKFSWYELIAKDHKKAQSFYREVLGWRIEPFPMGDTTYDMIYAGDQMIGGFAKPKDPRQPPHWISYVSVEDVDATVKAAKANGGRVVEAPYDIPDVGRMARIADPQGAELCPFKSAGGNDPDGPARVGSFFWNELHTTDAEKALAFYEKVLGFTHRTMDMGPSGKYHIISRGGVDRGGVTSMLPSGTPPHWLPYVNVEDPDATLTRAKRLDGKIHFGPEDIPGVGRFGVIEDVVGAFLAVMKPKPM
jgi:uncharacterized protein